MGHKHKDNKESEKKVLSFIFFLFLFCSPNYFCSSIPYFANYGDSSNYKNYKLLKKYDRIIDSKAIKFSDTISNKNGLFQIDSVKNTHFDYYCSITEPIGNTIAKGYYKNNIPVGVWVKYNKSTDSNFNEYFFMENGICMKHVFYWHHDGSYFMDSITPTIDTLIRMSFNTKFGQRDYFYIPKKGEKDYFEWKDIDFRGIAVYPTSIYSYHIKREDWTEKGIVYKEIYRK